MENNLKSIVYVTINTVNSKLYVGVHITETPFKFDNYWGCGITGTSSYHFKHPKTPFQRACKKYGLDAFKRYTLFVFDTYEEALEMEKLIVTEEFIKRPDVYNVALGGGAGLVPSVEIEIHQYDLEGNYIKSFRSYSDAGRQLNTSYQNLISAVQIKGICKGYYWSETRKAKLDISNYKSSSKVHIYLYNEAGEFYKEFDSFSDAAKDLEVNYTRIQKALKYHIKCEGYFVTDQKVEKLDVKNYEKNKNRPIYRYDKDRKYIDEFINIKAAEKFLNKKNSSLNRKAADKNFYEGFYWSFEKHDILELSKAEKRKLGQYDLNGNLVKIWDSYRACEKEFSNIRYVLNGARASTKGYTFKYLS